MSRPLGPRAERIQAGQGMPTTVGESPVWRAQEGALYWVDIPAQKIAKLHLESGTSTQWLLPERVGCIAFDGKGSVLAACESGLFAVALPQGGSPTQPVTVQTRKLAAPTFPMLGMRFNDGRCDRQGRFWAGTMLQDMAAAQPVGSLFRFDESGRLSAPIVSGLIVQNGLAWSPEGETMYLSDSHPSRRLIWAFDYDVATGEATHQRIFADLHHYVGRPDGAAVDADGCYWICANDAGRVLRFTPQGVLDGYIDVPAVKPSMCAFGGADLDTLFITSIRPSENATEHDGHLFAVRPGVRGLQEPVFAGVL